MNGFHGIGVNGLGVNSNWKGVRDDRGCLEG